MTDARKLPMSHRYPQKLPRLMSLKDVAEVTGISYSLCQAGHRAGGLPGHVPLGMKKTFYTIEDIWHWFGGRKSKPMRQNEAMEWSGLSFHALKVGEKAGGYETFTPAGTSIKLYFVEDLEPWLLGEKKKKAALGGFRMKTA